MKQYTTTLKDRKHGFTRLPEARFRLFDEEILGTEESKEMEDNAIDLGAVSNETADMDVPDEDEPMQYVESQDMDLVNPRESYKDIN